MLSIRPTTPAGGRGRRDSSEEGPVMIIKSGWLHKQGGARGGRKSWKRRWFVLKEDCMYYYSSPDDPVLLGVMPLHSAILLDLASEVQTPPPRSDQKVCHECKKTFTLTLRRHFCRHCGNSHCDRCASKYIRIPKYGFNTKVRVCDACYEICLSELESSQQYLAIEQEEGTGATTPSGAGATSAGGGNGGVAGGGSPSPASANANGFSPNEPSEMKLQVKDVWDRKLRKFTLPAVQKPHLFALKNSERELWLHADNVSARLSWVEAIKQVQNQHKQPLKARAGQTDQAHWEIDSNQLTMLNKVGVGAFGTVFRARLWGTEVASKTLKTEEFDSAEKLVEELKKEVSILSQLRHPNVVLYIGACTRPPNVCIITEWCSRGSLYDVLHDHNMHINASLTIDLAMGISQGMNYLHSLEKKIIHRDLKSHNILVNKSWQVKVADFGLSHVRERHNPNASKENSKANNRHYGIFGTPEWMAPEVMEGNVYTEKIDVYSFGILLSELVTRQMPFHDIYKITNYMDVVDAVLDNGAIPTIPRWCENFVKPLILMCLNRDPAARPSFTDIILRLREFTDLDDSVYFFQFDLPRLRELMMSHVPSIQALAASELAAILTQNPKIRRIDEGGSGKKKSFTSKGNTIVHRSNTNSTSSNTNNNSSSSSSSSTSASSSSSPSSSSARSPSSRVHGDLWVLDDEDAHHFLERFTALLSSSNENVQLSCCRALSALLTASDRGKRAQDRELIVAEGGIRSLLSLLTSHSNEIVAKAGEVLLLLTSDLSDADASSFIGLEQEGLSRFTSIVDDDIAATEEQLAELQTQLKQKREWAEIMRKTCADEEGNVEEPHKKPKVLRKQRSNKKNPMKSFRFESTSGRQQAIEGQELSAENEGEGGEEGRREKEEAEDAEEGNEREREGKEGRSESSPSSNRSSPKHPYQQPTRKGGAGSDSGNHASRAVAGNSYSRGSPVTSPTGKASRRGSGGGRKKGLKSSNSAVNAAQNNSSHNASSSAMERNVDGPLILKITTPAHSIKKNGGARATGKDANKNLNMGTPLSTSAFPSGTYPSPMTASSPTPISSLPLSSSSFPSPSLASSSSSSAASTTAPAPSTTPNTNTNSPFLRSRCDLSDPSIFAAINPHVTDAIPPPPRIGLPSSPPPLADADETSGGSPVLATKTTIISRSPYIQAMEEKTAAAKSSTAATDGELKGAPTRPIPLPTISILNIPIIDCASPRFDKNSHLLDSPLPVTTGPASAFIQFPHGSSPRSLNFTSAPLPDPAAVEEREDEPITSVINPAATGEFEDDSGDEEMQGESEPKKQVVIGENGWSMISLNNSNKGGKGGKVSLTSAERSRVALHDDLLRLLKHEQKIPDAFREYYGSTIKRSGPALRFDLDSDKWCMCYLLLLQDELRVFTNAQENPDDATTVIRVNSESSVRCGNKHGMPNCFTAEDCGFLYTFCAGSRDQQTHWRRAILGPNADRKSIDGIVESDSFGRLSPFQGAGAGAGSAVTSESVPPPPSTPPPPPPPANDIREREKLNLRVPVSNYDGVSPAMQKNFTPIRHHGYLMVKEKHGEGQSNNGGVWTIKYCLVVNREFLMFESHKSPVDDILYSYEVDTNHLHRSMFELICIGEQQLAPFQLGVIGSQDLLECTAIDVADRNVWQQAFMSLATASITQPPTAAASGALVSAAAASCSSASSSPAPLYRLSPHDTLLIYSFVQYYGRVDCFGFLFRKRKYSQRWVKQFFILIDSEIHYYQSPSSAPDNPEGTFYICTNSGKAFLLQGSPKRAYCFSIQNPNQTFYLAAESENEYVTWMQAIRQNVKRLNDRRIERHLSTQNVRQLT